MQKIDYDRVRFTEKFPFFAPITGEMSEVTYEFTSGENLLGEDRPLGCVCILEWTADVFRITHGQEAERVGTAVAGEIVGEGVLFAKRESRVALRAKQRAVVAYATEEVLDKLEIEYYEQYEIFLKWMIAMTNRRLIDVDYELALVYGLGELFHALTHAPDALRRLAIRIRDLFSLKAVSIIENHPTLTEQSYVVFDSVTDSKRPKFHPVVIAAQHLYTPLPVGEIDLPDIERAMVAYIVPLKLSTHRRGYIALVADSPSAFTQTILRVTDHIAPLIASMIARRQEVEEQKALDMRHGYV